MVEDNLIGLVRLTYGVKKIKQPKRGHLWLNDGSCIRFRATHTFEVEIINVMYQEC